MKTPSSFASTSASNSSPSAPRPLFRAALVTLATLAIVSITPWGWAQTANRVTQDVDAAQVQALPNHHPQWANASNDAGLAPAKLVLDQMTIVLARSPEQESAFEKLLADQQNPASPDYHRWLTPAEVGERFGLSEQDIYRIRRHSGRRGSSLSDRVALLQREWRAALLGFIRPHDPGSFGPG